MLKYGVFFVIIMAHQLFSANNVLIKYGLKSVDTIKNLAEFDDEIFEVSGTLNVIQKALDDGDNSRLDSWVAFSVYHHFLKNTRDLFIKAERCAKAKQERDQAFIDLREAQCSLAQKLAKHEAVYQDYVREKNARGGSNFVEGRFNERLEEILAQKHKNDIQEIKTIMLYFGGGTLALVVFLVYIAPELARRVKAFVLA